jgi:solute carrier family 13 (sodium-dependent dicarboxylate transporter), member 2/3/5
LTGRALALVTGPLLGLVTAWWLLQSHSVAVAAVSCITLICVVWWVFEPLPIPVTSLLPLALLPLAGVLTPTEVAQAYGSPLILLLLGGFLLSKAMEHSGAHRRLALGMVNLVGASSERRLVLGFMIASAGLSMWISNTATTLMLLPVALAVLEGSPHRGRLAVPLLLGIAYAASVGGLATPIGTPPNLIFMQVYADTTGERLLFSDWMRWGVPVTACMVPLMAVWLTRGGARSCDLALPAVGAWRPAERRVLCVFALTALAWVTRGEPWGGWSAWLHLPYANDASVALLAVVVLFLVPSGARDGQALLTWERAVTIPWGVLLLFAGGICLAQGFVSSGLSDVLGAQLAAIANLPLWLTMLVICLGVTFMTETTSNTASATLLMPVLAAAGIAAGVAPELLMVPAAMSASCAFMLPVATAPNAVVYSSGLVTTRAMAREGFAINLIGALLISSLCFLILG